METHAEKPTASSDPEETPGSAARGWAVFFGLVSVALLTIGFVAHVRRVDTYRGALLAERDLNRFLGR